MGRLKQFGVKRIAAYAVTLLIMAVIYSFSAQTGVVSSSVSFRVTETLAETIFFNFGALQESIRHTIIDSLAFFVRKAAHFCIYAALGVSVFVSAGYTAKSIKSRAVGSFLVCVIYAALDETHQLFVAERAGMFQDVIVDSAGAALGIGFAAVVGIIKAKVSKNDIHNDKA